MFEEYTFESWKRETWPKITKDTTIEELEFIHKKIWDYVVEHGRKPKAPYINNCPACEYAFREMPEHVFRETPRRDRTICPYCPIRWPDDKTCSDEGSLYNRWRLNELGICPPDEQKIARLIRDVEWKEDLL